MDGHDVFTSKVVRDVSEVALTRHSGVTWAARKHVAPLGGSQGRAAQA